MSDMSLCFADPFLLEKFNNGKLGFNVSQYKDFLLGRTWDHRMLDINFENVTKRWEDYLVRYNVGWRNGTITRYETTSPLPEMIKMPYGTLSSSETTYPLPKIIKEPYPTFVGPFYGAVIIKCYGIKIPKNAEWLVLAMKRDIFPGAIRPNEVGLGVSFHYPNQFFRSHDNANWDWPTHTKSQNQVLKMVLRVNTIEVSQRRNSRKKKCNKNWKEYDLDVARHYLEKMECRPVYGIWDSSYPTCNSSDEMKMALSLETRPQIMEPCQSADKIVFDHVDKYITASAMFPADSFLVVVVIQTSRIKVIEQKRAYELQTLIGNSGGYIGLILGTYSIHISE
jgi:hypothetical protein